MVLTPEGAAAAPREAHVGAMESPAVREHVHAALLVEELIRQSRRDSRATRQRRVEGTQVALERGDLRMLRHQACREEALAPGASLREKARPDPRVPRPAVCESRAVPVPVQRGVLCGVAVLAGSVRRRRRPSPVAKAVRRGSRPRQDPSEDTLLERRQAPAGGEQRERRLSVHAKVYAKKIRAVQRCLVPGPLPDRIPNPVVVEAPRIFAQP